MGLFVLGRGDSASSAPGEEGPPATEVISEAFVSYCRRDSTIALDLFRELEARGRRIVYDQEDVHGGENWRQKLTALIAQAQNIIFFISPASLESKECRWELDLGATLNKRVITVLVGAVEPGELPQSLSAVQWIDATRESNVSHTVDQMIQALETDQEWAEFHTRLALRVQAWQEGGDLLRGKELHSAEGLVTLYSGKRPYPTSQQTAFLIESRKAARRRLWRAGAGAGVVALVVGLLTFAWILEQRNARYIDLRRQGEQALNRLDTVDVAAAVASLGHVVMEDRQEILPEYADIFRFWQPRLRPIQEIIRGAATGELIRWRGRYYLKTATQTLQELPAQQPALAASVDKGKMLVVAEYGGVSLLKLPSLEKVLHVSSAARLHPDAIYWLSNANWYVAAGSRVQSSNDEDRPDWTDTCLTVVIPNAPLTGAPIAKACGNKNNPGLETTVIPGPGATGAFFFCTDMSFTLHGIYARPQEGLVVFEGYHEVFDTESDPLYERITLDVDTCETTVELVEPGHDSGTASAPGALVASRVYAFPQEIPEPQIWQEAGGETKAAWRKTLAGQDTRIEEVYELLDHVDPTTIDNGERWSPAFQGEEFISYGIFTDESTRYPWGTYISGNSYEMIVACKIPESRGAEWCKGLEIPAVLTRRQVSKNERWIAVDSCLNDLKPLQFVDVTRMKLIEPREAPPSLIVGMDFNPAATRLAALTETDEILVYALDQDAEPRVIQRIPLGSRAPEGQSINRKAQNDGPCPSGRAVAFIGHQALVGFTADGRLFGVDPETGDILWHRSVEFSTDTMRTELAAATDGPFFAVHGGSKAQVLHATTGAPLSSVIDINELGRAKQGGAVRLDYLEDLYVSNTGEVAIFAGDRLFLRKRPLAAREIETGLRGVQKLTGISIADGRTPLDRIP